MRNMAVLLLSEKSKTGRPPPRDQKIYITYYPDNLCLLVLILS